jgi:hypothetical protein
VEVTVNLKGHVPITGRLKLPPGSPERPPSTAELDDKVRRCCPDLAEEVASITWDSAPSLLDEHLTGRVGPTGKLERAGSPG